MIRKYFLLFCEMSFHFLDGIVGRKKILIWVESNVSIYFFLLFFVLLMSNPRNHWLNQGYNDFLQFSSQSFIIINLGFKSMIYLIFVYGVR